MKQSVPGLLVDRGQPTTVEQFLHTLFWLRRHVTGQYRINEVPFVARFIQPDDTLLDVGPNAGSWTRSLSKLVEWGYGYAFEALPHYAQVLKLTVRLLALKNVIVRNQAVTNHNGR